MTFVPPKGSPLLDHCPATLPSSAYMDPEWFAKEQSRIWSKNWIYVGRHDSFAPGTLRRVEVAGQALIVASDGQGNLTAFHNTCRHRGAELCRAESEEFNGRLIRCPYHAWAYDTSGRLISTGYGTPTNDFDKSEHGLFPVAVKIWNGFVLLCLSETPPDLAPDMGIAALDNWPMADLVTGHRLEKTLECNWKIFWENYNECLHCPGIHPSLCDMVPVYREGVMSAPEAPGWSSETPADPVLREGAVTWTVNGQPCGPVFPNLSDYERALAHNFVTLYPSMFVVAHVDYVRAVSLRPLGPEKTLLTAEWLFPAETLAKPDFDLPNVIDFATGVLLEDGAACEMNQRGLRSAKYDRGTLMPQEFDIHAFHKWVLAQMED